MAEEKKVEKAGKSKTLKVKYTNKKCGIFIDRHFGFAPGDPVRELPEAKAKQLLEDYYDQFEGADSETKKLHEEIIAKVKADKKKYWEDLRAKQKKNLANED